MPFTFTVTRPALPSPAILNSPDRADGDPVTTAPLMLAPVENGAGAGVAVVVLDGPLGATSEAGFPFEQAAAEAARKRTSGAIVRTEHLGIMTAPSDIFRDAITEVTCIGPYWGLSLSPEQTECR